MCARFQAVFGILGSGRIHYRRSFYRRTSGLLPSTPCKTNIDIIIYGCTLLNRLADGVADIGHAHIHRGSWRSEHPRPIRRGVQARAPQPPSEVQLRLAYSMALLLALSPRLRGSTLTVVATLPCAQREFNWSVTNTEQLQMSLQSATGMVGMGQGQLEMMHLHQVP